jgi:hypothetical protein
MKTPVDLFVHKQTHVDEELCTSNHTGCIRIASTYPQPAPPPKHTHLARRSPVAWSKAPWRVTWPHARPNDSSAANARQFRSIAQIITNPPLTAHHSPPTTAHFHTRGSSQIVLCRKACCTSRRTASIPQSTVIATLHTELTPHGPERHAHRHTLHSAMGSLLPGWDERLPGQPPKGARAQTGAHAGPGHCLGPMQHMQHCAHACARCVLPCPEFRRGLLTWRGCDRVLPPLLLAWLQRSQQSFRTSRRRRRSSSRRPAATLRRSHSSSGAPPSGHSCAPALRNHCRTHTHRGAVAAKRRASTRNHSTGCTQRAASLRRPSPSRGALRRSRAAACLVQRAATPAATAARSSRRHRPSPRAARTQGMVARCRRRCWAAAAACWRAPRPCRTAGAGRTAGARRRETTPTAQASCSACTACQ